MTNEQNALSNLFAACWKNDALKARFMTDPKSVLAEHGINVPADMDVNVVENSDTCMNLTLPSAPRPKSELSNRELEQVAGGLGRGRFGDDERSFSPRTNGCSSCHCGGGNRFSL